MEGAFCLLTAITSRDYNDARYSAFRGFSHAFLTLFHDEFHKVSTLTLVSCRVQTRIMLISVNVLSDGPT